MYTNVYRIDNMRAIDFSILTKSDNGE